MLEVVGGWTASSVDGFGVTIPTDVRPGDLLLLWMGVPTTTTPTPPADDGTFEALALPGSAGFVDWAMGSDGLFGYANVWALLRYRFATGSDAGRHVALDHIHPAHTSGGDFYGWAELVVIRGVNPADDDPATYTHPWVVGVDPGGGSDAVLDGHWVATSTWQRAKPFFFYVGANWYPTGEATPFPYPAPTLQMADYGPPFTWVPVEAFDPAIATAPVVTYVGSEGVTMDLVVFAGPTIGDDSGDIGPPTLQVAGPIANGQTVTYAGLLLFIHDPEPTPDLEAGPLTSRVIFE